MWLQAATRVSFFYTYIFFKFSFYSVIGSCTGFRRCVFLLNFDFFLISFFLSSRPLVQLYRCAQAVKGGIVLWIICKLKKLAWVRAGLGFSYYNAGPGRAGIKCVFLNPGQARPAF